MTRELKQQPGAVADAIGTLVGDTLQHGCPIGNWSGFLPPHNVPFRVLLAVGTEESTALARVFDTAVAEGKLPSQACSERFAPPPSGN